MASIERQTNGKWRARYRDPSGRSRSKTFNRKADARRFLDSTGVEVERGEWVDWRLRRSRFDEWAISFEQQLVRLAPTTARRYRQILRLQVRPYFGGRPVAGIDYQDVETFIASLVAQGLGPKTVRDCVSVLSLVLKGAVRARAIRENPAAGHHIAVPRQRGQALTLDELLRLVDHTREEYRAAVLLLVYTGMRPSELCGLRVGSVDLLKGTVLVCETLTPVGSRLVAGPTKTGHERMIPLPRFLGDVLAEHLASRRYQLRRPLLPVDYVFVGVKGQPLHRQFLRTHVVRPALLAASLPENFRTYDLRHAHASQLIDMGASPLAIKERLGHTDVLTTFRRYGHLFQGVQERLAAELEEAHQRAMRRPGAQVLELRESRPEIPLDKPLEGPLMTRV